MDFEIIHFRNAETILDEKRMISDVNITCEYLFDELVGTKYRRDILRAALDAMGWREEYVDKHFGTYTLDNPKH